MNHTAGVFLFGADGSFGSIIDFHEDRSVALPKVRRVLAGKGDRAGSANLNRGVEWMIRATSA